MKQKTNQNLVCWSMTRHKPCPNHRFMARHKPCPDHDQT